jgi:hypothetical protein
MPTGLNSKLTVDDFTYQVDLNHTPHSKMSMTSSFLHKSNILVEGHIDHTGNWTQENIERIENYKGEEYPPIEDLLTKSNAYIQVMNIKIAGMVNMEGLAPAIREIYKKYEENNDDLSSKEFAQDMSDAYNANAALVVVYADKNEKIAEVEAYPFFDEKGKNYYMSYRFVFADESAADSETYFGDGFSELISDINDFIAELNEEYDLEIEPIEEE